ncbi:trichohyalin-like [Clinocottus analis]|uniref:trichohyalin-like n=1 Tax=Clinocottus analis TaxID=304258 RepID=UPI0035C0858F
MSNKMDRKLNSFVRRDVDRENQALIEFKKNKQKMVEEEEDRKVVREGPSTWERNQTRDQERDFQTKLCKNALAKQHLMQMKEKALQKAQEKGQKDLEMSKTLFDLDARELRHQKEQNPQLKEIQRKKCLEDISRINSYTKEQAEKRRKEEEEAELVRIEMEEKLLQRKMEEGVRSRRQMLTSQSVSEKLMYLKMKEAAVKAERDERSLVNGLAKRQAEQEKERKEKAEEKAKAIQSITAHMQKMIQERAQREEAERQGNAHWLQAQKEADRSFLEENKLKAQRTKEELVQLQKFNKFMEAEKLHIQRTLARRDYGTAKHTLGGGVSFSCDEGNGCIVADVSDPKKQLDTVQELTQDQKEMGQLCPAPPPAELRTDSKRSKHILERRHMDRENKMMVDLRIRKQKMIEEEEDRRALREGRSTLEALLRRDQERDFQTKLCRNALAGQHLMQMKEKALQKAQEKGQKDLDMSKNLYDLYVQEQRRQEEQKPLLIEAERKKCLEDISRINFYTKEQAEKRRTEEEEAELVRIEMEEKLLQRKMEEGVRSRRQMLTSQIVSEKLMSLKMKEAAVKAERDERCLVNGLAKRQAEQQKQQKETAEKNAKVIQSISAHREKMIQERAQREEAERQGNVDWLQAQKEADRSFLEENKLKAQRTKEQKIQLQKFNKFMEAEKLHIQRTLARRDYGTARNTLGGGVSFSCDERNGFIVADISDPKKQLDTVQELTQDHKDSLPILTSHPSSIPPNPLEAKI